MLLQKSLIKNSRAGQAQFGEVRHARLAANAQEQMFINAGQVHTNAGLIPRDVYQEFDSATVEVMREGDDILTDLLPLSKSVSIGKLVHKFRRASDAGNAQTSMTGQIGVLMDQVEYSYDGSIVPVHDAGFGREWREWEGMKSEGFDALIDDQRESLITLRSHLEDNFFDGHKDKDGNLIALDGLSWAGVRNDSRIEQIDLGVAGVNFDFTDNTKTGDEIKAKFIQIRDVMWITNKCERPLTYYVSREIASNMERKFSTQYDAKIIMQALADLMGVAAIKVSSKLTGNQLTGFPLDRNKIRPIVGMGLNTIAMPRPVYNSRVEFVAWGAIGFEVRTDYNNNTCAFYASV